MNCAKRYLRKSRGAPTARSKSGTSRITWGLGAIVGGLSCHFARQAASSPALVARAASRTFVLGMLTCTGFSVAVTLAVYAAVGAPQPP